MFERPAGADRPRLDPVGAGDRLRARLGHGVELRRLAERGRGRAARPFAPARPPSSAPPGAARPTRATSRTARRSRGDRRGRGSAGPSEDSVRNPYAVRMSGSHRRSANGPSTPAHSSQPSCDARARAPARRPPRAPSCPPAGPPAARAARRPRRAHARSRAAPATRSAATRTACVSTSASGGSGLVPSARTYPPPSASPAASIVSRQPCCASPNAPGRWRTSPSPAVQRPRQPLRRGPRAASKRPDGGREHDEPARRVGRPVVGERARGPASPPPRRTAAARPGTRARSCRAPRASVDRHAPPGARPTRRASRARRPGARAAAAAT